MANYTHYVGVQTGETIYAKPLPLNTANWGGDVIAYTEASTSGVYSATLESQKQYAVFVQITGSPSIIDGDSTGPLQFIDANIWDDVLTGATHNIATSAGRRLRTLADTVILADGTTTGGDNSGPSGAGTITLQNGIGTVCVGQAIRVRGQVRYIESYDTNTDVAVVDQAWCEVPENGDDYTIFNLRTPLVGRITTAISGTFGWVLANIQSMIEDVSGWRFKSKALEEAPVTICPGNGCGGAGAFNLGPDSPVRFSLVQRDDYSGVDGRQIDIPISLPDGYDPDGATVCFSMHRIRSGVRLPGQAYACVGTPSIEEFDYQWYLRLQFTASDLDLPAGTYSWTADITKNDRRITVRTGTLVLVEDIQ
jgi:hypothetical protein